MSCNEQNQSTEFPEVTILMPIYNRSRWLPLIIHNIKSQDWPHNKLSVIIDDDSDTDFLLKSQEDIEHIKQILYPINFTYINHKPRRSIGKKRNDLVKACKTKYMAFCDSDDVYQSTYLTYSYHILKASKKGCVGSDKMVFAMSSRDFGVYAIDCGGRAIMAHEATLFFTKKWFLASPKFANNSAGEGKNIFEGNEHQVAITNVMNVMVCLEHPGNTIDKLQFAKDENKLNIELSDELKNLIKNILKN
jgi:glycosyltransferase involved in cell wall biosynthesis